MEPVAGGDEFHQAIRSVFDVLQKRLLQRFGRFQVFLELDDVSDGLSEVGGKDPIFGSARGELKVGLHEVRSTLGFDVRFRDHLTSGLESVDLLRGQKHLGGVEANGPHHIGFQRLAWLSLVGDDGAQGEDAEAVSFEFAFLVGVHKIAAAALQALWHAVGQYVLDAVEQTHFGGARRR